MRGKSGGGLSRGSQLKDIWTHFVIEMFRYMKQTDITVLK